MIERIQFLFATVSALALGLISLLFSPYPRQPPRCEVDRRKSK